MMFGSLVPAKFRATLYYLGTIITGLLGIVLLFNGITKADSDSISQAVTGLITLLGGTAPTALAAVKTTQQISNGTAAVSAAIANPVVAAASAVAGIQAVNDAHKALTDQVTAGLAQVAEAANAISTPLSPIVNPLVQQFLDAGNNTNPSIHP